MRTTALRALACGAPVLFTLGWLLLGLATPGYSQRAGTISALAERGAATAVPMTVALVAQGLGQLAGAALARRRPRARATALSLAVGGLGTIGVAAFRLPGSQGPAWASSAHAAAATAAFGGLHLAALCGALSPAVPRRLRVLGAAALAVALPHLGWFLHDVGAGGGAWLGYCEKAFTTVLLGWCAALAWWRPLTAGPRPG